MRSMRPLIIGRTGGLRYTGRSSVSESQSNSHPNSPIDLLTTLFALGREVTSVLDLTELLRKIPELIARLTKFQAFAVYLLDPARNDLSIAYSVGYPDDLARNLRVKV